MGLCYASKGKNIQSLTQLPAGDTNNRGCAYISVLWMGCRKWWRRLLRSCPSCTSKAVVRDAWGPLTSRLTGQGTESYLLGTHWCFWSTWTAYGSVWSTRDFISLVVFGFCVVWNLLLGKKVFELLIDKAVLIELVRQCAIFHKVCSTKCIFFISNISVYCSSNCLLFWGNRLILDLEIFYIKPSTTFCAGY